MDSSQTLLKDYSDAEKGAYISAIASLATADRSASDEELDFLQQLADAADLSEEQAGHVQQAASDEHGQHLKQDLDVLKTSELRFPLYTDLVAFANSDQDYSPAEEASIARIKDYLGITPDQASAIHQLVDKSGKTEATPEERQGLFGMGDKLKSTGINLGSLSKGLLSIAGPLILGKLLSGRGSGGGLGGMLGGMLGGNSGGLGGMLGGNTQNNQSSGGGLGGMLGGGGLGSIIGMLNGGGIGSTGGLLGRILGR